VSDIGIGIGIGIGIELSWKILEFDWKFEFLIELGITAGMEWNKIGL